MSCNTCGRSQCVCGSPQHTSPDDLYVTENVTHTVRDKERVHYRKVNDQQTHDGLPPHNHEPHPLKTLGLMGEHGEDGWLMSILMWALPVIVLIGGALISVGANDFNFPTWTYDNTMRYPEWGFWTWLTIASLLYGVMWGLLYSYEDTSMSRWILHLIVSIPMWLGLTAIILMLGCDMPKEAAWVMYAFNGSLVAVTAMVAACSEQPEIAFLLAPVLMWGFYESNLNTIEAQARG